MHTIFATSICQPCSWWWPARPGRFDSEFFLNHLEKLPNQNGGSTTNWLPTQWGNYPQSLQAWKRLLSIQPRFVLWRTTSSETPRRRARRPGQDARDVGDTQLLRRCANLAWYLDDVFYKRQNHTKITKFHFIGNWNLSRFFGVLACMCRPI